MGLVDDREDFDPVFFDVIEYSHFSDTEPVLGTGEATEALDPAPAHLVGLVPEMSFDGVRSNR